MQIGNQAYIATDWVSLHRVKMTQAGRPAAALSAEGESKEEVSFKDTFEKVRGGKMSERLSGKNKAPYSYLADENGIINYNGVQFNCDFKRNRICLGDVSDKKQCISVTLSGGGSLVVNRANLGDLSKAIGMFSPEDVNRIMRAIAEDTMCQRKLQEIDETENSIGEAEECQETDEEREDEEEAV